MKQKFIKNQIKYVLQFISPLVHVRLAMKVKPKYLIFIFASSPLSRQHLWVRTRLILPKSKIGYMFPADYCLSIPTFFLLHQNHIMIIRRWDLVCSFISTLISYFHRDYWDLQLQSLFIDFGWCAYFTHYSIALQFGILNLHFTLK